MIYGETLSVKDTTKALQVLRIEQARRNFELARSCYWTCKNGSKIPVDEMTRDHLEATISMLERIENARAEYLERQGDW